MPPRDAGGCGPPPDFSGFPANATWDGPLIHIAGRDLWFQLNFFTLDGQAHSTLQVSDDQVSWVADCTANLADFSVSGNVITACGCELHIEVLPTIGHYVVNGIPVALFDDCCCSVTLGPMGVEPDVTCF